MSEAYSAIILGQEREMLGWTHKDTLALADGGELALVPLRGTLQGRVRRIARLRFEGRGIDLRNWKFDGESIVDVIFDCLMGRSETMPKTNFESLVLLKSVLEGEHIDSVTESVLWCRELRAKVVAVAWLEDRFDHIEDPAGRQPSIQRYLPVFLSRCDELAPDRTQQQGTTQQPDYFTSYAEAAKYARVTVRTIQNWIRDEWLKGVEKKGRRIRMPRSGVDKCMRRQ
jgi:excisionase family DNA binding protein